MRLTVFTVEHESFRYGDPEGKFYYRFATKELAEEFLEKETSAMRKIADITEYKPDCFEDSLHKWAYEYKIYEELIVITEKEEGELLNRLIVESRKDKISKLTT
jgi:hypothetical protein